MVIRKALILLICILAFVLRVYKIDSVPPSLNWDEVSHGYNAYSILKTGKDEWGKSFPISNFRAYGDYPLPLNLYLTIPFINVLGLNDLSIRLPHALLGTITALASYFLFLGITKRKDISLFGSLLVAIDPWHLFPSRFVLQSNLSVALLTSGMALFVNGIISKRKYLLTLSFVCLGLTLFAYHTTRIFSPTLFLAILLIYQKDMLSYLKEKWGKVSLLILGIFFILLPFLILNPEARARSKWVFILDQGAVAKIEEKRNNSKFPANIKRLIYNRPVYFASKFTSNYLGYFSPEFLFFRGGTQYQFSIPNHGVLYLAYLPFFYIGLFILLKRARRNKDYQFLLAWLVLAPVAASLTLEKYAVLRSSTLLPLPELLVALGVAGVFSVVKERTPAILAKALVIGFVISLFTQFAVYLNKMFLSYPIQYSQSWQYGYKQIVNYTKASYARYDNVVVTKKYGEPHEFFLFFWPWDPAAYQNDPQIVKFAQSDWFWVDKFDKFYFVNDWDIPRETNKAWKLESGGTVPVVGGRTLLITSPGNYPPDWKKLETIKYLDGSVSFEILEKI